VELFVTDMQQQAQPAEGGYPCSMFTTPPVNDLKCSICLEVLRDPVQVCGQQHVYCRGCISKWKATNSRCPECRAPFSKKQQPARLARNMILLLDVRCPHAGVVGSGGGGGGGGGGSSSSSSDVAADAEAGHQHKKRRQDIGAGPSSLPATSCEWTGQMKDYEAHVALCPFVEISCPFAEAGCAFRAARRDMGAHSSDMAAHFLMLMTSFATAKVERAAEKAETAIESAAVRAECAAVRAENEDMKSDINSLQC
jgi:hypothetical protein